MCLEPCYRSTVNRVNEQDLIRWSDARRMRMAARRIAYEEASAGVIEIARPASPAARVALTAALLAADLADQDERHFRGGLVRVTEYDIWSETSDRIGQRLIKSLTGDFDPSEPAPAFAVREDDIVGAQALLAIPMLFEWDACYVPESGRVIIDLSHDGPITIAAAELTMLSTALEFFRSAGWDVLP